MKQYGFSKKERLTNKKLIKRLFEKGHACAYPPFTIIWSTAKLKDPVPAQVLISVPKKRFKNAVSRNKLKRLIREAYRQYKPILYRHLNQYEQQFAFAIIYTHYKQITFREIQEGMQNAFKVMEKVFQEKLTRPDTSPETPKNE